MKAEAEGIDKKIVDSGTRDFITLIPACLEPKGNQVGALAVKLQVLTHATGGAVLARTVHRQRVQRNGE